MKVLPIKYDETKDWLLNVHYLKRMPPISYSFGLFDNNNCVGICGKKWESNVFELNRMVLEKPYPKGAPAQYEINHNPVSQGSLL